MDREAGKRDDGGKMKWHLLPVPALLALTKVFHGGSIKYVASITGASLVSINESLPRWVNQVCR
jgi:hypothetical protein